MSDASDVEQVKAAGSVGPGWSFLYQEDGSVVIPASIAGEVLRAVVRDLTERVRTDGGEVSSAARGVLRALHAAASQPSREGDGSEFGTPSDQGASVREVTVATAAELLGCSQRYVRRLAESGRVAARRDGWIWLIDRASLDAFRTGGAA
jgi:excisionase family DNA binding protein